MKKTAILWILVILGSACVQKKSSEKAPAIENNLISVSFYSDSTGHDPSEMALAFEKVNKAIDSIGYPDAGYKLWLIQSDTNKSIRFMIQGSWPDQEIYNTIHKNDLYSSAMKEVEKVGSDLKIISYNRFTLVK